MRVILALFILAFEVFALEEFTLWWKNAKEVCIVGKYKNFDGTLRDIKPFCCKVHRIEVNPIKGYFREKFYVKEGVRVIASCNGAFYGVLSYDGALYAVSGKKGITKETPPGVLSVENQNTLHFVVCRSGADFDGFLSEVFAEGYVIKK